MYNLWLMALLADLNARYSSVNTQQIHNDFIDNPKVYDFEWPPNVQIRKRRSSACRLGSRR
jgi:hypothetical protein